MKTLKPINKNTFRLSFLLLSISLLFNNQHAFAQCQTMIDVDFNNWNNRRYSIADIKSDFNNNHGLHLPIEELQALVLRII